MFYFWNKGSKNFQNFFIPNFQIVYIYVFSAPRTLIAIFCLFSCFLLVIQSRTGIGSVACGACMGPFFPVVMFCCYVACLMYSVSARQKELHISISLSLAPAPTFLHFYLNRVTMTPSNVNCKCKCVNKLKIR